MSQSGRQKHRDRDPGRRQFDEAAAPAPDRVFQLTEAARQRVAQCLRLIDEARVALERQQNPVNREIIRELKASADRIFDLMNELEEAE